jgi:hypothetical protein
MSAHLTASPIPGQLKRHVHFFYLNQLQDEDRLKMLCVLSYVFYFKTDKEDACYCYCSVYRHII